jgi:8-oxo-dGTP diphosphatase
MLNPLRSLCCRRTKDLVINWSRNFNQSAASCRRPPEDRRVASMASKEGEYTYRWPRPALTVDAIIVAAEQPPKVLLIQRKQDPYAGAWALPGGFVDEFEDLEKAARRELQEETSVDPKTVKTMIQVGAFGEAGRDPRGWTVGVGYAAVVPSSDLDVQAADDAAAAQWFDIKKVPVLAFDHKLMLRTSFERLAMDPLIINDSKLVETLKEAADALQGDWRHKP